MDVGQDILVYGKSVDDIDTSPFEAVDMLHLRDRLETLIDGLDETDRKQLLRYDLKLLMNAPKMYEHMSKVHDFSNAQQPSISWWWKLHEYVKINELLQLGDFDAKDQDYAA